MSTTAAEILEEKIGRMGRELRASDLTAGILRTLLGILAILFVATFVEHWTSLGNGTWSTVIRWAVSILVWGVGGSLMLFQIIRVVRAHVNPVYAASLIEDAEPGLKNSLINWVYLRRGKTEDVVSRNVFQSLEMRTARTLVNTSETVVIDRAPLIRLGIVLGVLLTILCGYILFSPKNPLVTFARILVPWADIEAPTRVRINDPRPGDMSCVLGDSITVTAEIRGLRGGEIPEVLISTTDGRIQNAATQMEYREDTVFEWEATIPQDGEGTQQAFDYQIVAGDASTPIYHVTLQIPLTAKVDAVTYEYPEFTNMADERIVGGGNLTAPEGTRVSFEINANRAMASVSLKPEGFESQTVTMKVDPDQPQRATGAWTLEADPDRLDQPKYVAYRLEAIDTQNVSMVTPPRYRIRLIPNRLPQIRWTDPLDEGTNVPIHEEIPLEIVAEDSDYGIRRVTTTFAKAGEVFAEETVYEYIQNGGNTGDTEDIEDAIEGTRTGNAPNTVTRTAKFRGDRAEWNLKSGDRIEYWASVWDQRVNDQGIPITTEKRTFTVQESIIEKPKGGEAAGNTGANAGEKGRVTQDSGDIGEDSGDTGNSDHDNTPNRETKPGERKTGKEMAESRTTRNEKANEESNEKMDDRVNERGAAKNSADKPSDSESGDAQTGKRSGKNSGNKENSKNAENASKRGSEDQNEDKNNTRKNGEEAESRDGTEGSEGSEGSGGSEGTNSQTESGRQGDSETGENGANGNTENRTERNKSESESSSELTGPDSAQGEASKKESESANESQKPVDSQTEPGDAMERIIDFARNKTGEANNTESVEDRGNSAETEKNNGNEENGENKNNRKNGGNAKPNLAAKDGKIEPEGAERGNTEPGSTQPATEPENTEQGEESRGRNGSGGNATAGENPQDAETPRGTQNDSENQDIAQSGDTARNSGENSNSSGENAATGAADQERSSNEQSEKNAGNSSSGNQAAQKTGENAAASAENSNATTNGDHGTNESQSSKNGSSAQNNKSKANSGDSKNRPNDGKGKNKRGSANSGNKSSNVNSEVGNDPSAETRKTGAGDLESAQAAPKGTDGRDATESNDPALNEAARQAVEDGAEMTPSRRRPTGKNSPQSAEPSNEPQESQATSIPHDSDDNRTTGSETAVRPGDPRSQQELHPETPNRPAAQRSPDATSGDGRNSGGTRPIDRPEPVNAPGDQFRNTEQNGNGNPGSRPDENGRNTQAGGNEGNSAVQNGRPTGSETVASSEGSEGDGGIVSDGTRRNPNGNRPMAGNRENTQSGQNTDNTENTNDTNNTEFTEDRDAPVDTRGNGNQANSEDGSTGSNPGDRESTQSLRQNGPGRGMRQNPQASEKMAEDGSRESDAQANNVDFTRRNTELALRTLEESLKEEDPALLEQLGWSREEAAAFLERWRQIMAESGENTEDGNQARQAMRGLGLQSRDPLSRREANGQVQRRLRQSGVIEAPAEWSELYRRYRQGISGGSRVNASAQ